MRSGTAIALSAPRSLPQAAITAMRPRQWTKNLLLFAGIVFAAEVGDASRWLHAVAAFVAYCAASSAAYLVNDVRDAAADRRHPVKCRRPVAAGELSPIAALWLSALLAAGAVMLAAVLGVTSAVCLVGFVFLQVVYSLGLKHLVLLDVFAISGLFIIRAAAGAVAVDVRISPWLLICTGLLALLLALGKRRAELVTVGAVEAPTRPVLSGYSLALVDQLIGIVAAATIVSYALYTFSAYESNALMATLPFVVFGIFRYLLLLHRDRAGEEPDQILVTDLPILAAVCGWVGSAAVIVLLIV